MGNTVLFVATAILSTASVLAQEIDPRRLMAGVSANVPESMQAEASRNDTKPYLGVFVRSVTAERAAELKLKQELGAEITMVDRDAPAGKAGLQTGDVVVSFNGNAVESAGDLRRMIRVTAPGHPVYLDVSRNGEVITIKTELAVRNSDASKADKSEGQSAPGSEVDFPSLSVLHYSRRSGIVVENLSSQLAEFFGAKTGRGVLVRSVEKGSKGGTAGLKAGDIILKLDNEPLADISDWNRLMRKNAGKTVPVRILRDRREQEFSLPVSKHGRGGIARLSLPARAGAAA